MNKRTTYNSFGYRKWGLIGSSVLLWCLVISGIVLRYSSSSDFNYTKGELVEIRRLEHDLKNRLGRKNGTAYKVVFVLSNSETIFYIDNNFSSQHNGYIRELKSSNIVEVWSDGDLFDGNKERVYKLKADGNVIIPFDSVKVVYVNKSNVMLSLALFSTIISLIAIRPEWFRRLIVNSKKEAESLVDFYLGKFKSRKTEELVNIVTNKQDFHSDAVLAAEQILKERKENEANAN